MPLGRWECVVVAPLAPLESPIHYPCNPSAGGTLSGLAVVQFGYLNVPTYVAGCSCVGRGWLWSPSPQESSLCPRLWIGQQGDSLAREVMGPAATEAGRTPCCTSWRGGGE